MSSSQEDAHEARRLLLVSFNTDLFTSMKESKEKCQSIRIDKCVVKRSSLNENLEVIVNDKTKIIQSPKKFKVDMSLVEPDTVLSQINKIASNSH